MEGVKQNRGQILKELQSYKKYHNKTQQQISNKFESINDLRTELRRLENKSKKEKLITVKGEQYTEDFLYQAILHYNNLNMPAKGGSSMPAINQLNDDTWLNILLQSDMETLKTSCSLNKTTDKLCHDVGFWKLKFEQDGLFFPKPQKSLKKWILEYTKVKNAVDVATKLVNYILDKKANYFNIISVVDDDYDINKIDWLTPKLNNAIQKSQDQQDRSLTYNVEEFSISHFYTPIDRYGNELDKDGNIVDHADYLEFKDIVTKEEFIIYLAKLFYYFPKVYITNEQEVDEDDDNDDEDDDYDDNKLDIFISYQDLLKSKTVKVQLPEW